MKTKGFSSDALIKRGSRGVRENCVKSKFGFSSNSLRSGPPTLFFLFNSLQQLPRGTKGHYATFGASTMRTTLPCASRLLASMALP
jgi:hypothetical protein